MKKLTNQILGFKLVIAAILLVAVTLFAAPYIVGSGPAVNSKITGNDNRTMTVTYNLAVAASAVSNVTSFASFEVRQNLGVGFAVSGFLTNTNTALTFTYQRSFDGSTWEWPPQTLATGTITSNAYTNFCWITNISVAELGAATRFVKLNDVTAGTNGCTIKTITAAQWR